MKIVNQDGKEIELPNNGIIILLNPYSYNPENSFERVCKIVKWLRITYPNPIFSPILHTHSYDVYCKSNYLDHKEDYKSWDFQIYEYLKQNSIILFTSDWDSSEGCRQEMNWVVNEELNHYLIKEDP